MQASINRLALYVKQFYLLKCFWFNGLDQPLEKEKCLKEEHVLENLMILKLYEYNLPTESHFLRGKRIKLTRLSMAHLFICYF